jgi:dTDP-4-amino-4,6-dideoxygalactose transaminase
MSNSPKIYLSPPHLGSQEAFYIQQALEQNWVAPIGKNLDDFEKALCEFTLAHHCLALNSGTAALHLALRLLGVGKGDEVLCASFTFTATANPILYQSATPIFIDSEADTWNICPHLLEKALSDSEKKGKKPKAIIVVQLYGQMAKMSEIIALSNHYQVPIIEDAAEALGSQYEGQAAGTLGDLGILSFNGNKIITTSAGGALLTKTKEDREKALFWATQAKEDAPHYQHNELGYNYRLSNVLAGIGLGQMEVLSERIQQRRANFEYYRESLADKSFTFLEEIKNTLSNRWLTCMLTPSYEIREKIRLALLAENIESRPLWKPLHLQPLYEKYSFYNQGVSKDLFERGLCLPSGSALQQNDLDRIIKIIKKTKI